MRIRYTTIFVFACLLIARAGQAQDEKEKTPPDAVPDATAETANDDSPLKTDTQKTSYAIGVSIGQGLKRDGADVDPALVGRGLADVLGGGNVLLSDDEVRELIIAFQKSLRGDGGNEETTKGGTTSEGLAFLEANKKKEGVVTLRSGLQYKVLKKGEGEKPKVTDQVAVHYRGTLIDGTEFDSSEGRDPVEFALDGVIKGWTEALQLMPVGSKWQLFIPSELGYGDNPRPGGKIKPGDVLIFDVELLEIK